MSAQTKEFQRIPNRFHQKVLLDEEYSLVSSGNMLKDVSGHKKKKKPQQIQKVETAAHAFSKDNGLNLESNRRSLLNYVICICIFMWVRACVCMCLQRPEVLDSP